MVEIKVSRRALLGAFGAFVAAPTISFQRALAQPGARAGGVHVDVRPLFENSGEPTAGWVAQTLPAALAQAGVVGPVSVRIDYVLLGPNTGGVGPTGASPDQMIGVVTVGGVERPLRATSNYYPSPVDQTMIAQSNFDRVSQLSQAFAFWVARGG